MSFNAKVASILYAIAEIHEIKGDQYKSRAYNIAARRVTDLTEDIRCITQRDELEEIPGIGKSISKTIKDYIENNESKDLQKLQESLPKGFSEMIKLEGVGPKNAIKLSQELGIESIQTLEEAAKQKRIRNLKGFGPKKEKNLLKAIKEYQSRSNRFLLGEVFPFIEAILKYMKDCQEATKIEITGSVRRRKETVGDLDILALSTKPELVSNHFIKMPLTSRILSQGHTKSQIILNNQLHVDLRVIPPQSFGSALQYFTGSKEHNIKLRTICARSGYKLNEYGLYNRETNEQIVGEDEKDIYQVLGMSWIPPELRENTGEIEEAIKDTLPDLVLYDNIKGDLHVHSDWSDGKASIKQMVMKAISMNFEYIAITDHTKNLAIANGLDEKRLQLQMKEIDRINAKFPEISILKGTECDILSDGSLDLKNQVLKDLDFVVASIHSNFRQDEETMTRRMINAIHNEYVKAIGHPTGRLIQRRKSYEIDLERVFEAASQQDVAMEINGYPSRLDLKDVDCRRAKEYGVKLMLGSDAHDTAEMEFLKFGVFVARRGWLTVKDIINTRNYDYVLRMRS